MERTREEKILSLTWLVQSLTRKTYRDTLEDVAWIAVIELIDKRPDAEGDDLRKLARIAIRRRMIDEERKTKTCGREIDINGKRAGKRVWFQNPLSLDLEVTHKLTSKDNLTNEAEARISIAWLRKHSRVRTPGRQRQNDRAWNMAEVMYGQDLSLKEAGKILNIDWMKVSGTIHRLFTRLRKG